MVYNILTLPVVIFYIVNGLIHLYYSLKLRKKFPEIHNFAKSLAVVSLWFTAGLMYPLFFITDSPNIGFFQFISMIFICIITPFIIFLILFYQYRKVGNDAEIKERRCLANFFKDFKDKSGDITDLSERSQNHKTHTFKTDLHRKTLHLFPAGMIIMLWLFGIHIWGGLWNANEVWGITAQDFAIFLIIVAGYSGIFVFAALDYIRLSCIYERGNVFWILPDNVLRLLGKAIKRKEFYEFIGPTILVLSFIPSFIFARIAFGVFAAAMLIATIGDGVASLTGIKFGKHSFPKGSHKTVEGYVAGFLGSFGIALIALLIFEPQLIIMKTVIIALSGAFVFLVIDLLDLKIDDNILNPIFCGLIMALLFIIL